MLNRLRFNLKVWFHETRESLVIKAAYLLPRRVALWAFVRVCAATREPPYAITYESAYKAWEAGAGR